jgi:hypothetical protein
MDVKATIHVSNDQTIQDTICIDQNITGSWLVYDIQFQMSSVQFTNTK